MANSKSKQNQTIGIAAIIVVLLFLFVLLPFIRQFMPHDSHGMKQQAQFHSILTALELFNSEFEDYPPSDALDPMGRPYCGALKLSEAMMGQDLMGFHPDSIFNSNGRNGTTILYPDANSLSFDTSVRKGPYLPLENSNPYTLSNIYDSTGHFAAGHFVLCDVYKRVTHRTTHRKIGMPILYYKADRSKTAHDINDPNNPDNIYNYKDNHDLLALGVPGIAGKKHPMYEDPTIFYKMTKNYKVTTQSRPLRADTFILISAGFDGLYGTKDDIANFDWKWKP